ncbi:MAG: adenosine kinase [Hyphomicrobiaceae bacterium]
MSDIRYDVVGIGNAIVDIIGRCDDDFLVRHGAPKGHMRLVDSDTISQLYDNMGPATESSGGSAANTLVGVASLGGRAAFIGKVAGDEFGRIFAHDIRAANVDFHGKPVSGGAPTARSLILVTPDGERTMNTFLGISTELDRGEIDASVIAASKIVYLEGYLFDRPEAKAAFRHAATLAREAGRKVALTLSDGFCVDRHRGEFLELIRNGVDILFANESEIKALYQTDDFNAATAQVEKDARLTALTRSAKGSLILSGGERVEVPAQPISKLEDTTGAGDLYAAGFLYGIAHGHDLATAGRLGSLAAAEVISHVGARPLQSLQLLARNSGLKI